jgi:hypothetical protein
MATVKGVRNKRRGPNDGRPGTVPFDAMRLSKEWVEPLAASRLEPTVVPMAEYFSEIEEALRSMHGACLYVFAERQFIGRVESTDRGPLWLSAYWVQGGRVDSVRRWYLQYLLDDPQRHTRDMLTMTDCIHLVEHPERATHCEMFHGTYFDSDINFDVDPTLVIESLKKGTKKLIVGPPN